MKGFYFMKRRCNNFNLVFIRTADALVFHGFMDSCFL